MSIFVDKLKERLEQEESKSLTNIKAWRDCGAREAELNSVGEVVAFSLVKDIMEELDEFDISPVKFGRWLLKYATAVDSGNGLCYKYEGVEYNTDELYKIFSNQL